MSERMELRAARAKDFAANCNDEGHDFAGGIKSGQFEKCQRCWQPLNTIRVVCYCGLCGETYTQFFQRVDEITRPPGWDDWGGNITCPRCSSSADPQIAPER